MFPLLLQTIISNQMRPKVRTTVEVFSKSSEIMDVCTVDEDLGQPASSAQITVENS